MAKKLTSSIVTSKNKLSVTSSPASQQQNTTTVKQGNRKQPTSSVGGANNTPVAGKPITTRNHSTTLIGSRPNPIGDTASQTTDNGVWNGPSSVARNDAQVIKGNDSPQAQSPGTYNWNDGSGNTSSVAAGSVGLSPTKPNPNPNSPTGKQYGTS